MSKMLPINENFPFTSSLSFTKLEEYWQAHFSDHPLFKSEYQNSQRSKNRKKLLLKENEPLLTLMMSVVFPHALMQAVPAAAYAPFEITPFFSTTAYDHLFSESDSENVEYKTTNDEIMRSCTVMAYLHVVKKFFRPDLAINYPTLLTTYDKRNNLEKVYNFDINTQFADIQVRNGLPALSDEKISQLLNHLDDPEMWMEALPPENFHFEGFTVSTFTDVTVQEMRSSIKYYLLKRDAVTCGQNFLTIQNKIRSIIQLPNLSLGLVFFDPTSRIISHSGVSKWNSLMKKEGDACACAHDCFSGSIYDTVYSEQRTVVVPDLKKLSRITSIEEGLIKKGLRSLVIAPLIKDGHVIGILELASEEADRINALNTMQLQSLLPMFTAAVDRVLGDLQLEVRATIQKECTAIHPAVEWKFLEAGYGVVRAKHAGENIPLPEIRFENIYPLYGMSDIRGSSEYRNQTVREDLLKNLHEASHVLQVLFRYKPIHVLDELRFRVDGEAQRLENGIIAGDEAFIMDFLISEINPALRFIASDDKLLQPVVAGYFDLIDPELGIIYDKRKDFEISLTQINNDISTYLDHAEAQAQEILPHYFEKYKTDGIEYNIYVGNALLKDNRFDPLYLKNFRLWQLIVMSEIGIFIREKKNDQPYPLEITQLILVHSQPLSIHFRKDEKRFDVDGAYNIRYEIIKKRIDKAFIKGTSERLTQPGKIVIVYNQEKEAQEYEQYINYLRYLNYVDGTTERLELEDLQGVKGLKALRISISDNAQIIKNEQNLFQEINLQNTAIMPA